MGGGSHPKTANESHALSDELIGNCVALPEQRVLLCTIDKRANTLPTRLRESAAH